MNRALSVRRLSAVGSVIALAALGLFAAMPAHAAATTRYVANGGSDTGACTVHAKPCRTIGYAVTQAASGDTVSIAPGTYPESVRFEKSLSFVGAGTSGTNDTKVTGAWGSTFEPGSGTVTLQDLDISGNAGDNGVLATSGAAQVTIIDSVISGNGAGVRVQPGQETVTVTGTTLSGNVTGIALDGRVGGASQAQVTVSGSTLSHNGYAGAGVVSGTLKIDSSTLDDNPYGGVYITGGTVTLTDSTLTGNSTAGVYAVGSGVVTLTRSTVSGGDGGGGGVFAFGGSSVHVDTSTIFGVTGQGVLADGGAVTVANSTIAGTKPASGSTGAVVAGTSQSQVSVSGSIVAGGDGVPACVGSVTDSGYNLATDDTCTFAASSLSNQDPDLLGLAANGGPTQTMLTHSGSPARDVIPSGRAGCTATATDQRGVTRLANGRCDAGAVEIDIKIGPKSLPDGTVGKSYRAALSASGGADAYVWSLPSGSHLPDGLRLSRDGVISGTPDKAGIFRFSVSVNDPFSKAYTITVAPAATASPSASSPPAAPASGTASSPAAPSSSGPPSSGAPNLANTGAHSGQLVGIAAGLLGLGLLALGGAGRSRRRHG